MCDKACLVGSGLVEAGLGECPICFDAVTMKNIAVTECGHMFHSTCIFRSLELRIECPLCRHALVEVEEEKDDDDDTFMSHSDAGADDAGADYDSDNDWETVGDDVLDDVIERNLMSDFTNVYLGTSAHIKHENEQMGLEDRHDCIV